MNDIINANQMRLKHLASDIKSDIETRERSKVEWVRATIALCQHLAEARDQFIDNAAFGKWFDDCGFALNKNDRAAAIDMGRDLEQARKVLAATKSASLQLIHAKEFRLPSARKTDNPAQVVQPTAEPVVTQKVKPVQAEATPAAPTKPEPAKAEPAKPATAEMKRTPEYERALFVYDRRKLAGESLDYESISKEAGTSNTPVRKAIAVREEEEQRAKEAEVLLSASAQEKLEVAMRAYQRKLDLTFETRVMEEMKKREDELSIPYYLKQIKEIESVMNSPYGREKIMTKAEYMKVLACLHPDSINSRTKENLEEAFRIFNHYRARLADDAPERAKLSTLPKTREEMLARKRRTK